jgi:hypothetical protein
MALASSATAAITRLQPFLIQESEVAEWPGTTLTGGRTARMLQFGVTKDFTEALLDMTKGLFDWQQPGLPEDLGFLRPDHSVWMASIAHERDAYFELTPQETDVLVREVPSIRGIWERAPKS